MKLFRAQGQMSDEQIAFLATLTSEEKELFMLQVSEMGVQPGMWIPYGVAETAILIIKAHRIDKAYQRAMSII